MPKPKPKDRRLHNTRILLHALGGGLRMHIEQGVMSTEDLEALERAAEIMPLILNREPGMVCASIAKSKTRSEILLVNAERLYSAWVQSSRNGAHRQRCRIVHLWYFQKLKLSDIAYNLNRTQGTVLDQLRIALDELGVCFFGNNGLSLPNPPIPKGATVQVSVNSLPKRNDGSLQEWCKRQINPPLPPAENLYCA